MQTRVRQSSPGISGLTSFRKRAKVGIIIQNTNLIRNSSDKTPPPQPVPSLSQPFITFPPPPSLSNSSSPLRLHHRPLTALTLPDRNHLSPRPSPRLDPTRSSITPETGVLLDIRPQKREKSADSADFSLSSGGRTRTSDLRVMSPTSYQLLYPAVLLECKYSYYFNKYKTFLPFSFPSIQNPRGAKFASFCNTLYICKL